MRWWDKCRLGLVMLLLAWMAGAATARTVLELDTARQRNVRAPIQGEQPEEAQPLPQEVTVNGMIRRNDGRTTVWLNNKMVAPDAAAGGSVEVRPADAHATTRGEVAMPSCICSGTARAWLAPALLAATLAACSTAATSALHDASIRTLLASLPIQLLCAAKATVRLKRNSQRSVTAWRHAATTSKSSGA